MNRNDDYVDVHLPEHRYMQTILLCTIFIMYYLVLFVIGQVTTAVHFFLPLCNISHLCNIVMPPPFQFYLYVVELNK